MSGAESSGECGYRGPWGLFPVPYGKGVFGFHWFNFYNAICFQIILGAPTVLLAKDLGANSTILGIIAAFTPLMTTLQLPAARYLKHFSYRSFALMGWGPRVIFIASSACVPLLSFLSREVRLGILLGSLLIFNVLRGFSSAAFLPWITGLLPSASRGRYIAVDSLFVNGGSVIIMLLSALMMSGHVEPWRYSLVLWISVAGAFISLLYLRKIPDGRQLEALRGSSDAVTWSRMFANLPFRNSILFSLLFSTVAGGLGVFPVEYLKVQAHFTPSAIYALSAGTFLAPLFIMQRVGRLIDRTGSIRILRVSVVSFAVVLGLWFAMSAGILPPDWKLVLLLNVTGGMAMSAFNMANLHLGMEVVPAEGRNHYFAVTTVITSFAMGIVPVLWGRALDALGTLDLAEGPFHLRRHSIYFLGISLLSFATLLCTRILIEPGKQPQNMGK
jgi:MFS family permease